MLWEVQYSLSKVLFSNSKLMAIGSVLKNFMESKRGSARFSILHPHSAWRKRFTKATSPSSESCTQSQAESSGISLPELLSMFRAWSRVPGSSLELAAADSDSHTPQRGLVTQKLGCVPFPLSSVADSTEKNSRTIRRTNVILAPLDSVKFLLSYN